MHTARKDTRITGTKNVLCNAMDERRLRSNVKATVLQRSRTEYRTKMFFYFFFVNFNLGFIMNLAIFNRGNKTPMKKTFLLLTMRFHLLQIKMLLISI